MSLVNDNAICRVDDTLCPSENTDAVVRSKASLPDAVKDDVAADDGSPDDSLAPAAGAFPVKPPQHTAAASCPPSPPSDVERTSAEGRTCDGDEQIEPDDDNTTS